LLVPRLLGPIIGGQEAPPHYRYVKAVFDADCVLLAFIVFDVELEKAFARDF
jgi:hypothetical protein